MILLLDNYDSFTYNLAQFLGQLGQTLEVIRNDQISPEQIAEKMSKDRTTVVNFLRLLKLPDKIQQALRKGHLTAGHARALIALPDEQTQLKLFDKIIKNSLNVRQVENLVKDWGVKTEKKVFRLSKASAAAAGSIAEKIQHVLGTKVRVNVHDGGKGEIVIEFYSNDDLERIFDLLTTIEQ